MTPTSSAPNLPIYIPQRCFVSTICKIRLLLLHLNSCVLTALENTTIYLHQLIPLVLQVLLCLSPVNLQIFEVQSLVVKVQLLKSVQLFPLGQSIILKIVAAKPVKPSVKRFDKDQRAI